MKAIVAMASNRVIGVRNGIPWYFPEDLKFFKQMTMGGSLLMGRKTFQSLGGKPLTGRYIYVLTTIPNNLQLLTTDSYEYIDELSFKERIKYNDENVWVCGGETVYQQFLPYCSEVYVTHIIGDYYGDTYMPEFESKFGNQSIIHENENFWIVKHWNRFCKYETWN